MNGNHSRCCGSFLSWLALGLLCSCPVSASAQVVHGPQRIRNVYIPADQLELLFDGSSKGVLMPRDRIMALWEEGQRQTAAAAAAPRLDEILSQAAYEARLEDHELRMTGRIQIAKLREGWQTVDLAFGGLAIESAQVGGRTGPVWAQGRRHAVPGTWRKKAGSSWNWKCRRRWPAKAAIWQPRSSCPRPGVGDIDPATERQATSGRRDDAAIGRRRGRPAAVPCRRRPQGPGAAGDFGAFGGGSRAPSGAGQTAARSTGSNRPDFVGRPVLDLDVYACPTDTFQIQLPDTVDLAEVEAPELGHWTVAATEGRHGGRHAELPQARVSAGVRFGCSGWRPFPRPNRGTSPTVRVLQSASHVGQVSVYCSPSLQVEVGRLAGIRPERPAPASAPAAARAAAVCVLGREFQTASVRNGAAPDRASVDRDSGGGRSGRRNVAEQHHGPTAARSDFRRASAVAARLGSHFRAGGQQARGVGIGAVRRRRSCCGRPFRQTVRFESGQAVEPGPVAGNRPDGPAASRALAGAGRAIPRTARCPSCDWAARTRSRERCWCRRRPTSSCWCRTYPTICSRWLPAGCESAGRRSRGTALQYHYQDDCASAVDSSVRTKPAKIAAETLAFVRLDRGKLDVHYQLDLHIRQGLLRQIDFTLPSAVGEKIQIVPIDSAARVIEQRRSPQPAAGDGQGGFVACGRSFSTGPSPAT